MKNEKRTLEVIFSKPLVLLEENQTLENKPLEDAHSANNAPESTAWGNRNTTIDIEMNAGRQETGAGQKSI